MSMIQEELVREAIIAVRFPLVEKHRKGEKIRVATVQSEWPATNSASISTEAKTISTRDSHCNSLVSRKRDWSTLWRLVAIRECRTCLQCNKLIHLIQATSILICFKIKTIPVQFKTQT